MFSKPTCGWTNWSINGHKIGSISYLSDVPAEFINACCDYLLQPTGFNLVLDGEGNDKGLSLIGNYFCTYSFHGEKPPYLTEITAVSDFILANTDDGPKYIKKLLKEAINDFERDFELWATWKPGIYEEADEIAEGKASLQSLINKGKNFLTIASPSEMELGNFLFGNSRGDFALDRDIAEAAFNEVFGEGIFDTYGYLEDNHYTKGKTQRGGYENNVFSINPYYWGDDDSIAEEPNFFYKPDGIEICWYKYMFRDSYSNVPLSYEKLVEIFRKSLESMKESK